MTQFQNLQYNFVQLNNEVNNINKKPQDDIFYTLNHTQNQSSFQPIHDNIFQEKTPNDFFSIFIQDNEELNPQREPQNVIESSIDHQKEYDPNFRNFQQSFSYQQSQQQKEEIINTEQNKISSNNNEDLINFGKSYVNNQQDNQLKPEKQQKEKLSFKLTKNMNAIKKLVDLFLIYVTDMKHFIQPILQELGVNQSKFFKKYCTKKKKVLTQKDMRAFFISKSRQCEAKNIISKLLSRKSKNNQLEISGQIFQTEQSPKQILELLNISETEVYKSVVRILIGKFLSQDFLQYTVKRIPDCDISLLIDLKNQFQAKYMSM